MDPLQIGRDNAASTALADPPPPVPLRELMARNPEAFKFDDIRPDPAERDIEAEAPLQRVLGGYMAIPGMPGWFTREMTLRQEIELADMADELRMLANAADAKPSDAMRAALPIAALIIYRRNHDGDIMPVNRDDILDNFKGAALMEIVRSVSGFGQVSSEDPTPALPTTD